MKIVLDISFEHAVGFLSDPYEDVLAPSDFSENDVIGTSNCIAFMMRPYFEGRNLVTISSKPFERFDKPVYRAELFNNSGVLSLSDSNKFNYCMLPVNPGASNVEIFYRSDDKSIIYIHVDGVVEI